MSPRGFVSVNMSADILCYDMLISFVMFYVGYLKLEVCINIKRLKMVRRVKLGLDLCSALKGVV